MRLLGTGAWEGVEVGKENAGVGGVGSLPLHFGYTLVCFVPPLHTIWSVIILVSLILASIPSFIPK